jgi:SAM-dependent methyltransferase
MIVTEGVQTPRYLLRRHVILHLLRRYEPGRFLEIGCGRGELLPWLARRGFEGVGLEISQEALSLARQAVLPYEPQLRVCSDAAILKGERFRYLFAFDVLEHLEDDTEALNEWRKWLEPEGRLILSVPAHMKKWTAADEIAGHYRRYERTDLLHLLATSAYKVEALWNYGFPLTSLTVPLRAILYAARLRGLQTVTKQERTLHSSLEAVWMPRYGARLLRRVNEAGCLGFHFLQLLFLHRDLGDGYIVSCKLS